MRTTTIHTPLHPADSIGTAHRASGGAVRAVQSVMIVAGCVALGVVLLIASLMTLPIRVARRLLRR